MKRDTSELCHHALSKFAFLRDAGWSETHEVGPSHFSIEFTASDSRVIGIGAFLPRYEYDVSLRASASDFVGLDELVAIVDPDLKPDHRWTWAHSDPDVFTTHISYSSELLRKYGSDFFNNDSTLWSRVSAHRQMLTDFRARAEKRQTAEEAFKSGRWHDAISIYDSLSDLSRSESKRLAIAKRRVE